MWTEGDKNWNVFIKSLLIFNYYRVNSKNLYVIIWFNMHIRYCCLLCVIVCQQECHVLSFNNSGQQADHLGLHPSVDSSGYIVKVYNILVQNLFYKKYNIREKCSYKESCTVFIAYVV